MLTFLYKFPIIFEKMDSLPDLENLEDEAVDREAIRTQLSTMSFEDLFKLKEKIGAKVYNKALFGENTKKRERPEQADFKRENKNRPREMSSKRPPRFHKEVIHVKKNAPRDPRFDPLCGSFDEKEFKKSYKFLNEVKVNERKQLKEELDNTEDPKRQRQIRYLIQRIDNQIREKEKTDKEKEKHYEEKREIKQMLKRGEKPEYQKKSDKKIMNLLNQYEELKQSKKLNKHIEKKSKKEARKDFKKIKESVN